MVKNSFSIFTNMISRINEEVPNKNWPISLELPKLESLAFSNIIALDLATPLAPTESRSDNPDSKLISRKVKKVTACPHKDRKHYAKNMCNNCYHRQGRNRLAWDCDHTDR
jgi:hypothetical protein